jgi:heterodisulfide reductase subunit B2
LKYIYYPGCSGETTSKEYNESAVEVCNSLGIEFTTLPDWSCCGASSGHSTDYLIGHSLVGRNLAIAEKEGGDIAVVCPACFVRLNDTRHEFLEGTELKEKLPDLLQMPYTGKYKIKHFLDILSNDIGVEKIKEKVTKPLNGLKVVAYYGCYLVRPPKLTGFDDPENPQTMDRLLSALGAEVLDWRGKISCCGGSLSLTNREVVKKLVSNIFDAAREVGADAVVTACGLCDANLESRQTGKKPLPVFYFTELMGLAMGFDPKPWFGKHLIDPKPVLKKYGLSG